MMIQTTFLFWQVEQKKMKQKNGAGTLQTLTHVPAKLKKRACCVVGVLFLFVCECV